MRGVMISSYSINLKTCLNLNVLNKFRHSFIFFFFCQAKGDGSGSVRQKREKHTKKNIQIPNKEPRQLYIVVIFQHDLDSSSKKKKKN